MLRLGAQDSGGVAGLVQVADARLLQMPPLTDTSEIANSDDHESLYTVLCTAIHCDTVESAWILTINHQPIVVLCCNSVFLCNKGESHYIWSNHGQRIWVSAINSGLINRSCIIPFRLVLSRLIDHLEDGDTSGESYVELGPE